MEITRHFTATTYVIYQDKVLLHWHKKLNCWLPPGGHIDRDELPEAAAVREVKEETGLDVTLLGGDGRLDFGDDTTRELHPPAHILLEQINPFHQHIDLIFYAEAESLELSPGLGETEQIQWFTAVQLQQTDMPANVRICALEALNWAIKP